VRIVLGAWAALFLVSTLLAPHATAQDEPEGTPAYLLRLERMRPDDSVCVLVRSDGRYHLERSDWDKTEVFEGDLPEADLHRLERWVGENELFDLTQEQIIAPIFKGTKDELALGVRRPGYWQNLLFPSPSNWQRYEHSVVPLMQWFEEIRKARYRVKLREEEGRTNCKPPYRPKLTTRSAQKQKDAVVPFVFFMQTTSFKGKDGEKRCAIVYPNGRYHRETKSQRFGSDDVSTATYEGLVTSEGMRELAGILTSPEILNHREPHLPWGIVQTDSEITGLTFAHEGKARTAFFWRYAPVPGLSGHEDESGMKALEPLREWLKANAEAPNATPLPNAPLSDCVPPRLP
jgi:hypothetical protein